MTLLARLHDAQQHQALTRLLRHLSSLRTHHRLQLHHGSYLLLQVLKF